jgi:hypothetical protein
MHGISDISWSYIAIAIFDEATGITRRICITNTPFGQSIWAQAATDFVANIFL